MKILKSQNILNFEVNHLFIWKYLFEQMFDRKPPMLTHRHQQPSCFLQKLDYYV